MPRDGRGDARLIGLTMRTGPASQLTVSRSFDGALRLRSLEEKVALSRAFEDRVVPGFEDGSLQVVVDRRYRLADIAEAHAYMETNASVGKIALDVATD